MLQNVSMCRETCSTMLRGLFLAIPLVCISVARAGLGGDTASIVADAAQLHGVVQPPTPAPSGMVAITADNGITVHEFLDTGGRVYAVNWSGPALPDLKGLLGGYFTAYTAVLSALPNAGRQRTIRVVTADLVVLSGGHLRAYNGLAYLPSRVPAGVAPESLRSAHE
jgi:hypothetical protein